MARQHTPLLIAAVFAVCMSSYAVQTFVSASQSPVMDSGTVPPSALDQSATPSATPAATRQPPPRGPLPSFLGIDEATWILAIVIVAIIVLGGAFAVVRGGRL